MLENFLSNTNSNSGSNIATSPVPSGRPPLSTPRDSQSVWRDVDYEGDSSFSAHSKSITQVIEKGLRFAPGTDVTAMGDVAAAVASLRNFLDEKSASSETVVSLDPSQDVVDYPELSNLSLPPMPTVLALLKYAKTHPLKYLNDIPNMTLPYLTTLCQRVYFPAEEFTIATFITVHASLSNLFRELSHAQLQDLKLSFNERDSIVALCLKNTEIALRNLRLHMQPTYENIEALVHGSTLAMDLSQASLAWTLVSSAVRMAQDAGYHRLPSFAAVAHGVTRERRLFWFLYCVERGMALNLGRSSSIRDHDIQTDLPKSPDEFEDLGGYIWGDMFNTWTEFARIQGDIYDQLYCVHAQKEPAEAKAVSARKLADRLKKVQQNTIVNITELAAEPYSDWNEGLMTIHVSVVQYSTLCLIYRMIPPENPNDEPLHPLKFCDEAIAAAREALTINNEAWIVMRHRSKDDWRSFVHWTLLWCPFVPYIVLVGNVIADRNIDDFKLLEKCVDTLQSAAQLSPNVSKLYRACRIFYEIAKIYLSNRPDGVNTLPNQVSPRPSTSMPPTDLPQQGPPGPDDIDLPDFPLSQEDFNGMLDEWDLGIGAGNAKEMSAFFEQYMPTAAGISGVRSDYILPGNLP